MSKYYTGVGSRSTPLEIMKLMTNAATFLEGERFILRSGAAYGADAAFERGVTRSWMKQIFLPWKKFNDSSSTHEEPDLEAFEIAKQFHSAWDDLSPGAKRLMARNVHQLLGPKLKLSEASLFVLCWTPRGAKVGGTAQAIRMAEHYQIPVFNLGSMSLERASEKIFNLILSQNPNQPEPVGT